MSFKRAILGLAVAALAAGAQARDAPLMDPGRIDLLVPADQPASPAKVRQALVYAATMRGWTLVDDQPGRLKLNYNKADKHRVTVQVSYDARGFDIRYADSFNLNYAQRDGTAVIHPNYNRWVNNLAVDARNAFKRADLASPPRPASAPN